MRKISIYFFLVKRDGLLCGICGRSLITEWNELLSWRRHKLQHLERIDINIDIDHIVPKPQNDRNRWKDMGNLQLTHRSCNQKKGNMVFSW